MGTFVPTTAAEREQMLRTIGVSSVEDLFRDVPQQMYLDGYLDLPPGRSELETLEAVSALAERNRVFKTCLRGAGSYRHYIPAAVKAVVTREEFVTAYTPYQAEISQGILQGIFEYQTMLCELTGMDVTWYSAKAENDVNAIFLRMPLSDSKRAEMEAYATNLMKQLLTEIPEK